MSDDESDDGVSQGVSSQNESLDVDGLLEVYDEIQEEKSVSNPKKYNSGCNGNIATECIIDGLELFSEIYQEQDIDTALYGGLATQLRALADSEELLRVLEPKAFGRRYTSDIDAMISREDYSQALTSLRDKETEGLPNIDFNKPYIPGTEDMIERAEDIDFSQHHEDYNFVLPIPRSEDLVYTKIFAPIGNKKGTKHDLDRHLHRDDLFNMNPSELYDIIVDRSDDVETSMNILSEFNYDPRL